MDGAGDLGIVGENVLEEVCLERQLAGDAGEVKILSRLDFGRCRLALAVPKESPFHSLECLDGRRTATT